MDVFYVVAFDFCFSFLLLFFGRIVSRKKNKIVGFTKKGKAKVELN